jgi:hypothetical protein
MDKYLAFKSHRSLLKKKHRNLGQYKTTLNLISAANNMAA